MKSLYTTTIAAISILISGCGTFLAISEVAVDTKQPDALVINRPAIYNVDIKIYPNGKLSTKNDKIIKSNPISITGVDHTNVITLNATRMPFSDGKLSVTLNDAQLMTKVELTSKTGADRAANAVKSGFDARNEIAENRKKAKAAETN